MPKRPHWIGTSYCLHYPHLRGWTLGWSHFPPGSPENLFGIYLQLSFQPGFPSFPTSLLAWILPPFPGPLASKHCTSIWLLSSAMISCLVASQRLRHPHALQVFCARPVTLTVPHFNVTKSCQFHHNHLWIWLCFFFLISIFVLIISTLRVQKSPISLICYLSLLIPALCSTELLEINAKIKQKWKLIWSLKALIGICWPRG